MSADLLATSIVLGARKNGHASRPELIATRARTGRYGSANGVAQQQPKGNDYGKRKLKTDRGTGR